MKKSVDVVLGSNKEFVITNAPTHGPGHGVVQHTNVQNQV